jgi:small subunit ribosomal protein S7
MPVPLPLNKRQRRRTAIQWILTAAESRREQNLADRVAKELLNVAEGKGSAWERRQRVHKLAISARANIKAALGGPGMRRR